MAFLKKYFNIKPSQTPSGSLAMSSLRTQRENNVGSKERVVIATRKGGVSAFLGRGKKGKYPRNESEYLRTP